MLTLRTEVDCFTLVQEEYDFAARLVVVIYQLAYSDLIVCGRISQDHNNEV